VNCTFDDINCTGGYPAVFYAHAESGQWISTNIDMKSISCKNVNHSGTSLVDGLLLHFEEATVTIANGAFENISGANGFRGGVIYSNGSTDFMITSCMFEECISTGGNGGVLYINSTGLFTFVNCKFMNNDADSMQP
jgi:hypothetical protein